MIERILKIIRLLLPVIPLIVLLLFNPKTNLKRAERSKQFPMPVLALLYSLILTLGINRLLSWIQWLLNKIPEWIARFGAWVSQVLDGRLEVLGGALTKLSELLARLIAAAHIQLLLFAIANALILLLHLVLKRILISIFKRSFKTGNALYEWVAGLFYERDETTGQWSLAPHVGQARKYLKFFYYGAAVIGVLAAILCCEFYRLGRLEALFYPVFGIIVVGELYFFVDGLTKRELNPDLEGEDDDARHSCNYALLRPILRKLFGDKLDAEDTSINNDLVAIQSNDELLAKLEASDDTKVEAYGRFMRRKASQGLELEQDYLLSGLDLLNEKSILFNNPFYYDLIPYLFYPMNRTMLRHKKVLIVLGRHEIEGDVENWCRTGLTAVTNIPTLWNIGVLSGQQQELDVGILTRSSVHDLALHEANDEFFAQVEFVVLIEPSKLITTAQVGLNSIVQHCRRGDKKITYCSTDKNCDGLLDALSHVLLTSLTEVSATNHHRGASSYMCWEADDERLQHRLLPNISRYLGVGTELSFAALKNQVEKTIWYGGDAFPVVDIHWIVKQYYYNLLHYAELPVTQEAIDRYFQVTPNLWDARKRRDHYMTVEDESFNMFEVKRNFASRATEQGFVNVVTTDYLLRDYMAENDDLFDADPKAIPYIVADYDRTKRNVTLRLCLRLSSGPVPEEDVRRDLMLIDAPTEDLRRSLWHEICQCCQPIGREEYDGDGAELLVLPTGSFTGQVIRKRRHFSMELGRMQTCFYIDDSNFISAVLSGLSCAEYIAEDEKGERLYLGSELQGHIFQKYLPGQFFTFGGKYYEMLRVTSDGQVLVRRSADHITGRPSYRQVRNYFISNAVDSETMGDRVDISGLRITVQYADLRVETPAYWQMRRYNDFQTGRLVTINGVPERSYCNKRVLRIDFGEELAPTPEVLHTLTLLLNETFRTLFAENQSYIVAVLPGQAEQPDTYSLFGEGDFVPGEQSIYLIEDSQLDIGLLTAVERNLNRIFAIVCDYLDWHLDFLDKSLNPPPAPEPPSYDVPQDGGTQDQPEKKGNWFVRTFRKIRDFFKRLGKRIADFFRKLFRRKKKDGEEPEQPGGFDPFAIGAPNGAGGTGQPAEAAEPVDAGAPVEASGGAQAGEPGGTAAPAEPAEPGEPVSEPAAEPTQGGDPAGDEDEIIGKGKAAPPDDDSNGFPPLLSSTPRHILRAGAPESPADTPVPPADASEPPVNTPEPPAEEPDGDDTIEFEPDAPTKATEQAPMTRKPYHERYYLLYGGSALPEGLDPAGTLSFLQGLGFGDNGLKQARAGKSIAELVERNFQPNRPGAHYCDFCGAELTGTEYEILKDGRERCMLCSRTAIKTEAEFVALYKEVRRNLESFFGAKITVPISVKMVNSKRLHKRLGKTFVPTGNADGRTLGVAIKDGSGHSLLIENGAPRLQSVMTMAHELTHIWQYEHWDRNAIVKKYGSSLELEVYEGMAKWAEIQYAYLINEPATAKREEIITRSRDDEYGRGFLKYVAVYPLSEKTRLSGATPFDDPAKPL